MRWVVESIPPHGPIELFLVPTRVLGSVPIKDPLLLIEKSSTCSGDSGLPLSLSEWSFTIYSTPYKRKYNVLNASLYKTFLSRKEGVAGLLS